VLDGRVGALSQTPFASKTGSIGVRWDAYKNVAVDVQYEHVKPKAYQVARIGLAVMTAVRLCALVWIEDARLRLGAHERARGVDFFHLA
jgi:hypothetical protein